MEYITNLSQLKNFLHDVQVYKTMGFDLETTGLDWASDKIVLMSLNSGKEIYVFDWQKIGDRDCTYLVQLIKDNNITLIGHNLTFDIKFIKRYTGEWLTNLYDTMIVENIIKNGIESNRYPSLALLAENYLGVFLNKTVRKDFIGSLEVTQDKIIYAAEDVMYLFDIKKCQEEKILEQRHSRVVNEIENPLIPVTASMEFNGVYLDTDDWNRLVREARIKAKDLEIQLIEGIFARLDLSKCETIQDVYELLEIPYKTTKANLALVSEKFIPDFHLEKIKSEFNINSHQQIKKALNLVGIPLKSTQADAIEESGISDPLLDILSEQREIQKSISSFGDNFLKLINPVTGRIHTNFNQTVPQSGRYSSSNPNLQNIKATKEYRNAFKARKGYKIVAADYSQEEYRLAGSVSGEPAIIKAYKDGRDMHTYTAALVHGISVEEVTKQQRNGAKTINFSILYGTSAYGMAKKQKIDKEQAKEIISKFFNGYPVLNVFMQKVQKLILEKGYSSTLTGRKRYFPQKILYADAKERERELGAIKREGFNHIIQGSGGDIIKLALIRLFYENPFGEDNFRILITVHDEIVCEVKEEFAKEAEEFLVRIMTEVEQPFLGDLPAKAESYISDCWQKG